MLASQETEEFEIVTVQSGVRSLRARANGETFHPVIGPMAEAEALHVRQQRLVERAAKTEGPFVIWDVGLGAAANAIAALRDIYHRLGPSKEVELHSFDRTIAPLAFAVEHAQILGYLQAWNTVAKNLMANGRWGFGSVQWHLHLGDFRETAPAAPAPHAILYDPYSPMTNPELWTLEHFTALFALLDPARPCLLTNYTRSTAVRVTLLLAGFFVGRGHATGEKDQTTIASNVLGLLEDPLDQRWLERVERSTRGAPSRVGDLVGGAISSRDWQSILRHPQFCGQPTV